MMLLVFVLVFCAANAEINKNQSPALAELYNDENLLQQFRQWQQSLQHSEDSVLTRNYGGNPWLPQPQGPPKAPSYVDPQPYPAGNPWYKPPVQPQPGPYPPITGAGPGLPTPPPSPSLINNQPQPYPGPYPPITGAGPGLPTPPPSPSNQQYPGPYPPITGAGPGLPTPPPSPSNQPFPQPYPPITGAGPGLPTPPPSPSNVAPHRKYCLKPRGQFPARYCNKYVNCWDDVIIVQECPAGLMFSPKGYCDYDFNVDCRGREIPHKEIAPESTLPEDHKCPTPFGNYRSSKNCSEFFVCVHGSPIKFSCPSSLYYSIELGVCDYPWNVNCINPRPYPQPYPEPNPGPYPQPNPGPYPEPNPGPSSPGIWPPPKPVEETPQPIWNPYLRRLPADLVSNKSCIPNSIYRLEPDCSSIALCRDGKTEVINCGPNTGYNADSGLCVARHLAKC